MYKALFALVLSLVLVAPVSAAATTPIRTPEPQPDFIPMPHDDLTLGSRSLGVFWIQKRLIAENGGAAAALLAKVGPTGYFGPLTRSALAEFQAKHSIVPAKGYFGPKTRAYFEKNDQVVEDRSETFIGELTAVDTGCFVDGVCSATVGGKKVVIVAGLRPMDGQTPTVGSLKGVDSIGDLEAKVGSVVKVHAARATEAGYDYTLYGSTDYYLQVLAPMPKAGAITVRGTLGCLPPLDPNRPHIMLCALGLKGEDGLHYALNGNGDFSSISEGGKHVEIKGTFKPEMTASAFERVGTITVDSVVAK